jgi:hypothetical protein
MEDRLRRREPLLRLHEGLLFTGTVLVLVAWLGFEAAAEEDPFAPSDQPRQVDVFDGGPTPAREPAASPPVAPDSECPPLSERVCRQTNTSLLAMSGGYGLICLLLGVLLNSWWAKRGTSQPAVRFFVPLLAFATLGGLLVGFDPLRSTNLECCLGNATFRVFVILGDSPPARAVVLGAVPVAVLYAVIVTVAGAIQRHRLSRG